MRYSVPHGSFNVVILARPLLAIARKLAEPVKDLHACGAVTQ